MFPCSLAEISALDAPFLQEFTAPSMVEPCYNPSISDILNNPSLIVRRNGMYDSDDSEHVEEVSDSWNNDFQNVFSKHMDSLKPKSSDSEKKVDEAGKPSVTTETKRSEVEEDKDGPGAVGD